jgi:hypothetical protein
MRYILDGHTPVAMDDMHQWGRWMETAGRRVAFFELGGVSISTVFLGLDHQFANGPPLLFETMVFKGGEEVSGRTRRCSTWDEAEAQHAEAVAIVEGREDE